MKQTDHFMKLTFPILTAPSPSISPLRPRHKERFTVKKDTAQKFQYAGRSFSAYPYPLVQ